MVDVNINVDGLEGITKILEDIAPKHANNLLRTTINGIATEIKKEAKLRVPSNTGNLKKAIKAKRKKSPAHKPEALVYVEKGRNAKNDAFYWHFVEYGTSYGQKEQPFIRPAKLVVENDLPNLFLKTFEKKLAAKIKKEQKKKAVK